MNETLTLTFAVTTGAVLGVIFFGGLWWTVRKGISSKQPALWFFASLGVRMTVVLLGFLLIGRGHWQRLLACLAGFILARLFVTWKTRPLSLTQLRQTQGASHAP